MLSGASIHWAVAGGWALDLWRGRQTRPHGDLEITIQRRMFPALRRHLSQMDFFLAGSGSVKALPQSQAPPLSFHQVWLLDVHTRYWRLDAMLEQDDEAFWRFRRFTEITMPRSEAVMENAEDIPFLNPACVLLFKAKHLRPKDELDFAYTWPTLSAGQKQWLRDALNKAHPDHPWTKI